MVPGARVPGLARLRASVVTRGSHSPAAALHHAMDQGLIGADMHKEGLEPVQTCQLHMLQHAGGDGQGALAFDGVPIGTSQELFARVAPGYREDAEGKGGGRAAPCAIVTSGAVA